MLVLTDTQIQNYRRVLAISLGPYAYIMPSNEIIEFAENLQKTINDAVENENSQES